MAANEALVWVLRSATWETNVPQPTSDVDVDGIARDLESYVAIHRAAADTIEGIARWWLGRAVQPPLSHVEAALEALVRKGVLSRRSLPDGNVIYARAARTPDN